MSQYLSDDEVFGSSKPGSGYLSDDEVLGLTSTAGAGRGSVNPPAVVPSGEPSYGRTSMDPRRLDLQDDAAPALPDLPLAPQASVPVRVEPTFVANRTRSGSVLENEPEPIFDQITALRDSRRAKPQPAAANGPVRELKPSAPIEERSLVRAAGDTALGLYSGAMGLAKGAADNVNAGDNPVSSFIESAQSGARRLMSPDLRDQLIKRESRILTAQRNQGELAGARAAWQSLFDFPAAGLDTAAQGAGSLIPSILLGVSGASPAVLSVVNAASVAGEGAERTAKKLRELSPAVWAEDAAYQQLTTEAGASHAEAVALLAPLRAVPAQMAGAVAGAISGRVGFEGVLTGRAVSGSLRARTGRAGGELGTEQLETILPGAVANTQIGAVDGKTSWFEGLGRDVVDTAVGTVPGAALAASAGAPREPKDQAARALADMLNGVGFSPLPDAGGASLNPNLANTLRVENQPTVPVAPTGPVPPATARSRPLAPATDEKTGAVNAIERILASKNPASAPAAAPTGAADVSTTMADGQQPAGSPASGGVDIAGSTQSGGLRTDAGGRGAPAAAAPAPSSSEAVAVGDAAVRAEPVATLNDSGTLTIKGEPAAIIDMLRAGGVVSILPASNGVVVGKNQAEQALSLVNQNVQNTAQTSVPAPAAAAASPTNEDERLAGKRAIYAANKDAANGSDEIAANSVVKAQAKTNELGAPMTLWRHPTSGTLGLVPASQASPLKGGEKIGTLYPESKAPVTAVDAAAHAAATSPAPADPRGAAGDVAAAPVAGPEVEAPGLSDEQRSVLVEALGDDFERAYQQDIKDAILEKRGMAPEEKAKKKAVSPLISLLRSVGVSPKLAADIAGETNKLRANNILGGAIRNGGLNLDMLMERAVEQGFLSQQEVDEDGIDAGNKLLEMIQSDLAGERQVSAQMSDDTYGLQNAARASAELEAAARAIGFDTRGLDDGQVDAALKRITRRRVNAQLRSQKFEAKLEAQAERAAMDLAEAVPPEVLAEMEALAQAEKEAQNRDYFDALLAGLETENAAPENRQEEGRPGSGRAGGIAARVPPEGDQDGAGNAGREEGQAEGLSDADAGDNPPRGRTVEGDAARADRDGGRRASLRVQTDARPVVGADGVRPVPAAGDRPERLGTEGLERGDGGTGGRSAGESTDVLTSPTPADILSQQDRASNAQALDEKEQIDRESSGQTLTSQTAPEQRTDTSSDMFAREKAEAEIAKRNAGKPKDDNGTAPMFEDRTGPDVQRELEPWEVALAPSLATALRRWQKGRVGDKTLAAAVRAELDERKAKRDNAKTADRVRGADWIRERLLRARRTGELSEAQVDLAMWMLDQAPQMATDLGISIREGGVGTPNGLYNSAERVVTIFADKANDETATHEILHHTERMMPPDVQAGIRREWLRQLERGVAKAKKTIEARRAAPAEKPGWTSVDTLPDADMDQKRLELLDMMLMAARNGDADITGILWKKGTGDGANLQALLPYELSQPSEFWAVNGAALMREKAEADGDWVAKAKLWLKGLIERAKELLRLPSDAPVLRGLRAVMEGDGSRQSGMISRQGATFEDRTDTPAAGSPTVSKAVADLIPGLGLDETGRIQLEVGAKLRDFLAEKTAPWWERLGMKGASPELRRQLRAMKIAVAEAQETAVAVAKESQKLSAAEREMTSDIIEQELATGVLPPAHAVHLAQIISSTMETQTDELVRLGMLTKDSADKWRGKYLPRFYKSKLLGNVTDAWSDAMQGLRGKTSAMKGIKGKHLKGRGLYETIPESQLADFEALGWELRDDGYTPTIDGSGTVQVWRDFTRAERDQMGEIRDVGFRFVMGYMQTQKDIALGQMFEGMAGDPDISSRTATEDMQVQVPDTTVPGTGAKRYGMLAGRYVAKATMDHLSQIEEAQSDVLRLYREALGIWKEGKTVLNPVSHMNNVVSNLTMAHLAGVSYHRGDKYLAAVLDFAKGSPKLQEAKKAGLFLGTVSDVELMNTLPKELRDLAIKQESYGRKAGRTAFNVLSFGLRRIMGAAYQGEDLFFRYLIWKDATERGMDAGDAVDYAQKFIFNYDDLPATARKIRDFGIPFFSYTYKFIPAALSTAMTHPWRMAAPAAVLWTAQAAMYAMLAGDDDDDWMDVLKRYMADAGLRDKAAKQQKDEAKKLPPWMQGRTALGTPRAMRMGTDAETGMPLFIDVSRMVPGGDIFDVSPNAGGVPFFQWMTPSHPLFTTAVAMFGNKDMFYGKEITDSNDTREEATKKRLAWMWKQASPAIAVNNYHWERGMNALAQANGGELPEWVPDMIGGDSTGVGRDRLPVQPKYAAMQTIGIKIRPMDLDKAEDMNEGQKAKLLREIDRELNVLRRMNRDGVLSDRGFEKERERADVKKDRLRDGKTVDGDEKP